MLNRVLAKNFLSWKSMDFPISKGITLIDGWNADDRTSEGSGKSSILNAISWCIYGKLPKDANVDDVIKNGESSCSVALQFDNGDVILRSRKPNELFIQKATGEVVKGKDAKETQVLIEDYIGCNFETFCQSTYFAQNYDKKFLSSNQEERGKILSSIQNLAIFDKARKQIMDLLKAENDREATLLKNSELLRNNISHSQQKIAMADRFIQSKMDAFKNSKTEKEIKIQALSNDLKIFAEDKKGLEIKLASLAINDNQDEAGLKQWLDETRTKISEITATIKGAEVNNKTVAQVELEGKRQAEKYTKLQTKKEKLEAFIANPTANCPTCGTLLENSDTSHSKQELSEIDNEMTEVVNRLTEISGYLDDSKTVIVDDLRELEVALRLQANTYLTSLNQITDSREEVDLIKLQISKLDANTQSVQDRIDDNLVSIANLQEPDLARDLEEQEIAKQALDKFTDDLNQVEILLDQCQRYLNQLNKLKDGFKEIKSYIFGTTLNELNYRANQYLNDLFEVEAKIKFINLDQKIETEIYLAGQKSSLGLLSGGQSRRFNLAVDLALSDIVSYKKSTKLNFLSVDEYFKDLSEISMEKCLNLLKMRKCPVFLIEHNSIFKSIVDNVFFVTLENGTSSGTAQ